MKGASPKGVPIISCTPGALWATIWFLFYYKTLHKKNTYESTKHATQTKTGAGLSVHAGSS